MTHDLNRNQSKTITQRRRDRRGNKDNFESILSSLVTELIHSILANNTSIPLRSLRLCVKSYCQAGMKLVGSAHSPISSWNVRLLSISIWPSLEIEMA